MARSRHNKKNKEWKARSAFVPTLVFTAFSPLLIAGYCWEASTSASQIASGFSKVSSDTISEISKQTLGYTTTIKDNTSIINEALKVSISQEALSARQISEADKRAKQVSVAILSAQKASDSVMDVQLNYGATTGQGHQVCRVYTENKQLDAAMKAAGEDVKNKVNSIDNAPGRVVKTQDEVLKDRKAIHDSNFCTDTEISSGQCEKESDLPGGDSNASVLFTSSSPGSKNSAAKPAVRQNILGSPTLAIPKAAAGTVAGQAYLSTVNRKTALSAFPSYSLAYIESMSEKRDDLKDAKGNPQSPNDLLFNTVTRYYGGADAKEWTKSMIAQQPRGLLVELAKMEGLGAYMDYQEYLTFQRMEGNLASLTIATTLPMEQTLVRQDRTMKSKSLGAAISSR